MPRTGMLIRCLPSLPISSPFVRNLRKSSRIRPLTIWRKRWWSFSIFRTMRSSRFLLFERFDRDQLVQSDGGFAVGLRKVVVELGLADRELVRADHLIVAAT